MMLPCTAVEVGPTTLEAEVEDTELQRQKPHPQLVHKISPELSVQAGMVETEEVAQVEQALVELQPW